MGRQKQKTYTKKIGAILSGVALLLSLFQPVLTANAQIPQTINYQSRLRTIGGVPITATTTIQFSLYNHISNGSSGDAPGSAGPLLWKETYDQASGACSSVQPDAQGYFFVQLGSCSAFPAYIDFGSPLYLGVKISADAEAAPRVLLASFPYALNSQRVNSLEATTTATGGQLLALENDLSFNIATGTFYGGGLSINGTSTLQNLTFTVATGTSLNLSNYLAIGAIRLDSTGTNNTTSGAYLVGVFDEFTNSNATTVQAALFDLDTAITAVSSSLFAIDLQQVTDNGATTTNRIQFAGATSTGDILPGTHNTYSLGNTGLRWSNLWSGIVHVGTSTWDLAQAGNGAFTVSQNGGSERMRIESNGHVGIGTNQPEQMLSIRDNLLIGQYEGIIPPGGKSANLILRAIDGFSPGIQGGAYTTFQRSAVDIARIGIDTLNSINFDHWDGLSWVSRMMIDSTGNVGIGTILPSTLLHVQGGLNGSALLTLDSDDGNANGRDAGIIINSDNNNGSDSAYIIFKNNGVQSAKFFGGTSGSGFDLAAGTTYGITQSGFVRLHMTDMGNFGFATDTPVYRVDVLGDARLSAQLMLGRYAVLPISGYQAGSLVYKTTSSTINYWDGTQWRTVATAEDVRSSLWDEDHDTGVQVEESADEDYIRFDTAGTERMFIQNDGRVGINTTGPLTAGLQIGQGGHMNAALSINGNPGDTGIVAFRDEDGEDIFTAMGSLANNDFTFMMGDIGGAYGNSYGGSTYIRVDQPTESYIFGRAPMKFMDAGGGEHVGFLAPSIVTSSTIWTLPGADGVNNQVLITNGAGTLSWATSSNLVDNIYTADGDLTGDRNVNGNGYGLTFSNHPYINNFATYFYIDTSFGTWLEMDNDQMSLAAAAGRIVLNGTQGIWHDDRLVGDQRGIEYAADYSADYTNRSLVDKAYVDNYLSASAGSGLTWDGVNNEIDLGGSLTGNTSINYGNWDFRIQGGNSYQMYNNTNYVTYVSDGVDVTSLLQNKDNIQISGSAGFVGATYEFDYSANFTPRSLVDKEYVDNAIVAATTTLQAAYDAGGSALGRQIYTLNNANPVEIINPGIDQWETGLALSNGAFGGGLAFRTQNSFGGHGARIYFTSDTMDPENGTGSYMDWNEQASSFEFGYQTLGTRNSSFYIDYNQMSLSAPGTSSNGAFRVMASNYNVPILTLAAPGGGTNSIQVSVGTSTPETRVVANSGSLYTRTDGVGSSQQLYVKTTDGNNTGWYALAGADSNHWQKNTNVLSPTDSGVYQIAVTNNNASTLTGFKAVNTNDVSNYAGAVVEMKGSGADYTNNMYFGKYGAAFWIPTWAGNGVLATDKNLVLGAVGASSIIRYQIGGGYSAPVTVATMDSNSMDFQSGVNVNVASNVIVQGLTSSTNGLFINATGTNLYAANQVMLGQHALNPVSGIRSGALIYNTASSTPFYWDGTEWIALGGSSATAGSLWDADHDTGIQVEQSPDEDIIRFDTAGTEYFTMQGPRLSVLNSGSSVFLGQNAGRVDNLSNRQNVYVGTSAGYNSVTGLYNVSIGYEALYSHANPNNTTAIGHNAGRNYSGAFGGTMIGYRAGFQSTGNNNVMIGYESGMESSGTGNFFMGRGTGWYNTGDNNIMMGYYTGYDNKGSSNILFGVSAGSENKGNRGIFLGENAGRVNVGDDNIFLGYNSGIANATGTRNLFLGRDAGHNNVLGNGNIFLGYQAGYGETNSNRLYIDNSNTSAPLVYGEFDTNVFRINGALQINNPSSTGYALPVADGNSGQILVTNGNGNVAWASTSVLGTDTLQDVTDRGATTTNWIQFAGATSTGDIIPSIHDTYSLGNTDYRWSDIWSGIVHVGTSTWDLAQADNGAFTISESGNSEMMRITTDGYVGIGNTIPSRKLDIQGSTTPGDNLFRIGGGANNGYLSVYMNPVDDRNSIIKVMRDLSFVSEGWGETMMILSDDGLGIGTVSPAYGIDVVGDARLSAQLMLGQYALNPASGLQAGAMIYNTASSTPFFWNGTSWKAMEYEGSITLDEAYDAGGAGLGRQIIADSGAVRLSGAGNGTAFQIDYSGTNQGFAYNNSGAGEAIIIAQSGTGLGMYIRQNNGRGFLLDNNTANDGMVIDTNAAGTGIQITNDGISSHGMRIDNDTDGSAIFIEDTVGKSSININKTGGAGDLIRMSNLGTGDGIDLSHASSGKAIRISNTGTGDSLYIIDSAADTSPFVLTANGDLGIGATAPDARLEITGDNSLADVTLLKFQASNDADIQSEIYFSGGGNATNWNVNSSGNGGALAIYDGTTEVGKFLNNGLIINDGSAAGVDFRVESDTDTHAMFVDATNGYVGFDQSTPLAKLHVGNDTAGSLADYEYMRLQGNGDVDHRLYKVSGSNFLVWDYNAIGNGGAIEFRNGASRVGLFTNSGLVINEGGVAGVGLRVEGDTNANLLYTSAVNDRVGVGTGSPAVRFHVTQSGDVVAAFDRTTSDGTIISLRQDGVEEGTISVSGNTVSYNAFTGSHYAWTNENIEKGMLVSLSGENRNLHNNVNSEILYGVTVATEVNDAKIMGSYLSLQEPGMARDEHNPHLIMAVGNGEVWVADKGENINIGDYFISSDIAGHAQKDAGEFMVSHIVARAAESVDWTHVSTQINGIKHKKISVFFESFDKNNIQDSVAGTSLQGGDDTLDAVDLVVANAVFEGNITVKGHVAFGKDVVGQAMIMTGDNRVTVDFAEDFGTLPIVTLTPAGKVTVPYWVENASLQGFDIVLDEVQYADILFNWHAFGNNEGRVYVSNGTTMDIIVNDMGASDLETELNALGQDSADSGMTTTTEEGVVDIITDTQSGTDDSLVDSTIDTTTETGVDQTNETEVVDEQAVVIEITPPEVENVAPETETTIE